VAPPLPDHGGRCRRRARRQRLALYRARQALPAPGLKRGQGEAILTGWIRIGTTGRIVVQVRRQEMGQGITTTLPMLVAEEMDADPAQVYFEQAPIDPLYANATMIGDGVPMRPDDDGWLAAMMRHTQFKLGEVLGVQATGGSTSVRDAWPTMRRAGAAARQMLVLAAAKKLGVPASELIVERSVIKHPSSGKHAGFGDLADAASIPVRRMPAKDPARFTLLLQARLDIPPKSLGTAQFGATCASPAHYAAIVQCPVSRSLAFDGELRRERA
jgi:isoquinoline 1-oxidoreductase beta subunit